MSPRPPEHTEHIESELVAPPCTPNRRPGDEINEIVLSLESRWGLGLSARDKLFSPSASNGSIPDKVYSKIQHMYYKKRKPLDRILAEFNSHASEKPSGSEKLDYLLRLLTEEIRSPFGRKDSGHHQSPVHNLRSPLAGPNLTIDTEDVRVRRGITGTETSANTPAHTTQPGTPTDEEDEYTTPPQSPTLAAKAPNRHVQMGPPRLSESSVGEEQSSKFSKTPYGRQSRELDQDVPDWKLQNRPHSSFSISVPNVPAANTSFDSTTTSYSTVFSGDGYGTTATTNISFSTEITEPDDVDYPDLAPSPAPSSSATRESLDDNASFKAPKAYESHEAPLPQPLNDLSLDTNEENEIELGQKGHGAESRHLAVTTLEGANRACDTSPSKRSGVQYQVRDIPMQGLTIHEMPQGMRDAPFIVRWECFRISLESKVRPEDIMSEYDPDYGDYDKFWEAVLKIPACSKLRRRESRKAWSAAEKDFEGYTFKGKLTFNADKNGPLFNLRLDTLQSLPSCRFQRAFGADRFLYLSVPSFLKLPPHITGQTQHVLQGFQEWMLREHTFLGRKWRVYFVDPKSDKKSTNRPEGPFGLKIVLFATSGCDILPKSDHSKGLRNHMYHSLKPELTIYEIINWFIPLKLNAGMTFCKAYSRLELGHSKTTPGLVFRPSQLREGLSIDAKDIQEDKRFNDPNIQWDENYDPTNLAIMNDGCSRISIGAVREIWKGYNKADKMPCIFQGRIGGAKGVWMLSAPIGTTDPFHLDVWIEITKEQRKFNSHAEDLNDRTYDPSRLTLDIVKDGMIPVASSLHIAFIPILIDRGVPKEKLIQLMNERLDFERDELLELIAYPERLRKWINEQASVMEEGNRNRGIAWQANLPIALSEKIILLLEAGFSPIKSKYLADLFQRFLEKQLEFIKRNLRIRLGKATNLIGIADPEGVLEPGEVHVHFSSNFVDKLSGESYPHLNNMEVLVGRQPACRRSDIQKVRAVFKHELAHFVDIIVFSVRGTYPLAGKLQGGDYDGDTFWTCWEPELVKPFKNAPAPTKTPRPEDYGIHVDQRTLGDVMGDHLTDINRFLEASFMFRCSNSLLGRATRFHERLSYWENRIHSRGINVMSDVHDLLVDSSKNGYTLDDSAYQRLIQENPYIEKKNPPVPAYRIAMEENMKRKNISNNSNATKKHPDFSKICDHLYFKVLEPHTEETISKVKDAFAGGIDWDSDLQYPYVTDKGSVEDVIEEELQMLEEKLEELRQMWVARNKKRGDAFVPEIYNDCVEDCYNVYKAIMPTNSTDRVISRWVQRIPGGRTHWQLLKASALFKLFHSYGQNGTFAFHLAGDDLAYIKATASGTARTIKWSMYALLKPRKVKTATRDISVVDEDDSEYESAVENEEDFSD